MKLFVINSLNATFSAWSNDSSIQFVELGSKSLQITSDNNSTQLFMLCHGARFNDFKDFILSAFVTSFLIILRVEKTPSSKPIVSFVSISITWNSFPLYLLLVRLSKRGNI